MRFKSILKFLADHKAEFSIAPTRQQVADHLGLSVITVRNLISEMINQGLIDPATDILVVRSTGLRKVNLVLTGRQKEVLECIKSYINEFGYAPSRKDISLKMGFSSQNSAQEALEVLAKKGVIHLDKSVSRGIKMIEPGFHAQTIQPTLEIDNSFQNQVSQIIKNKDPSKAYELLVGSSVQFAYGLMRDRLPFSRSAHPLFCSYPFFEKHFQKLYSKVEGKALSESKAQAAIRIIVSSLIPSDEFNSVQAELDTEMATGKSFKTQSDIFRFYEALCDLLDGDGDRYFEFLRNHNPLRKIFPNDFKSRHEYASRTHP